MVQYRIRRNTEIGKTTQAHGETDVKHSPSLFLETPDGVIAYNEREVRSSVKPRGGRYLENKKTAYSVAGLVSSGPYKRADEEVCDVKPIKDDGIRKRIEDALKKKHGERDIKFD